jgi:CRISPR-associated protein Cas8a2/Csa4 subtype I-A
MRLYTPGFGELPDIYIAYGLFEGAIRAMPYSNISLVPYGERFVLEIESDEDEDAIILNLDEGIRDALKEMMELYEGANRVGYVSFSRGTNLHPGARGSAIKTLREILRKRAGVVANYSAPDHEQCGKGSKGITSPLPLNPQFGEERPYLFRFRASQIKFGKTCCFLTAWVGFHYYASFIYAYFPESKQNTCTVCALVPGSRTDKNDLLSLKDLATKVQYRNQYRNELKTAQLNLFSQALYLLSRGETLFPLKTLEKPWKITIYRMDKKQQGAFAIRGVALLPTRRMLEFVSVVKSSSPKWLKLLDKLIEKGEQEPISLIAESLLFNNTNGLYDAVKQIKRSLDDKDDKEKKLLDGAIVSALFKTIWAS